ncbi:hypothetical protein [Rothia nasimurium]|uniref:hypothetical protein n=1 Tax=Rothia nasimurium TaxID=85336 RepID=UPI001F48B1E9|nr:hypothetical protein [Rothia nasimurium]
MTPDQKLATRFEELIGYIGENNQHLIIEFLTGDFELTLPNGAVKAAQEWIDDLDEDLFDLDEATIEDIATTAGEETGLATAQVQLVGTAYEQDVTGPHCFEATFIWTFSDWFIKSLKITRL